MILTTFIHWTSHKVTAARPSYVEAVFNLVYHIWLLEKVYVPRTSSINLP